MQGNDGRPTSGDVLELLARTYGSSKLQVLRAARTAAGPEPVTLRVSENKLLMHLLSLLALDERMAHPAPGWKRAQARVCRIWMGLPSQESEQR